jgi:hypothetical protein
VIEKSETPTWLAHCVIERSNEPSQPPTETLSATATISASTLTELRPSVRST